MTSENYTTEQVISALRGAIEDEGSAAAWANGHGFSRQFICDVLKGRRDLTEKLAVALGFRKVLRLWERPNA